MALVLLLISISCAAAFLGIIMGTVAPWLGVAVALGFEVAFLLTWRRKKGRWLARIDAPTARLLVAVGLIALSLLVMAVLVSAFARQELAVSAVAVMFGFFAAAFTAGAGYLARRTTA